WCEMHACLSAIGKRATPTSSAPSPLFKECCPRNTRQAQQVPPNLARYGGQRRHEFLGESKEKKGGSGCCVRQPPVFHGCAQRCTGLICIDISGRSPLAAGTGGPGDATPRTSVELRLSTSRGHQHTSRARKAHAPQRG